MTYHFQPMTQQQAETIAWTWRYEGAYAFYNMDADADDLALFLDETARGATTFSIVDGDRLVGFVVIDVQDAHTVDIGLGKHPDLTGNGTGKAFVTSILDFIATTYGPRTITLAVATFNERAIRAYEACGFRRGTVFQQATNGSVYSFVSMTR